MKRSTNPPFFFQSKELRRRRKGGVTYAWTFVTVMLLEISLASIVVVINVRRNSASCVWKSGGPPLLITGGFKCVVQVRKSCANGGINKRRLHSECVARDLCFRRIGRPSVHNGKVAASIHSRAWQGWHRFWATVSRRHTWRRTKTIFQFLWGKVGKVSPTGWSPKRKKPCTNCYVLSWTCAGIESHSRQSGTSGIVAWAHGLENDQAQDNFMCPGADGSFRKMATASVRRWHLS